MGSQVPPERAQRPHPIFGPCLLWPNGWMDQVPLGMEVGLGPGDFVLDGDQAAPLKGLTPSLIWPMSIVAKWFGG